MTQTQPHREHITALPAGLTFEPGPGPDRPALHRPRGHCPRGGPAVETRWPDDVTHLTVTRIGVQHPDAAAGRAAAAVALRLLAGPHRPDKVERCRLRDLTGHLPGTPADEVLVCYWTDPSTHVRWWNSPPVRAWWDTLPEDGPLGHWVETTTTPVRRTETMYSAPHAAGSATLAKVGWTGLHDYPGAARDRIPATGDLGPGGVPDPDLEPGGSPLGRRVRIRASDDGLCFIRTAQDWTRAPDEQLRPYRAEVEPAYLAAVRHLARRTEGCLSAQFLDAVGPDGRRGTGSEAVLWFRSLHDLLRWARDHPTHHAILNAFWTAMIAPFGPEALRLVLWHEVHVLPENSLIAEYVNCRPRTGLLP
ncbi:phenylacetaldoxime dehydratase family protein [Saccharothrix obliqua]|uniref:phenylacetaldoxime dehydratase family protein n=1 Tax=Saccharothrix obliqua TaxID=2861747 RepID=UPI001C603DF0|nr:phenylacetaldoxime dehydratase family protein [Saccharothrix obliqua]MBW4721895.1 phenylacetaldoxime dehydratase family protein [Saccharothrix obliqua]